jgi:hypothetical protein
MQGLNNWWEVAIFGRFWSILYGVHRAVEAGDYPLNGPLGGELVRKLLVVDILELVRDVKQTWWCSIDHLG